MNLRDVVMIRIGVDSCVPAVVIARNKRTVVQRAPVLHHLPMDGFRDMLDVDGAYLAQSTYGMFLVRPQENGQDLIRRI